MQKFKFPCSVTLTSLRQSFFNYKCYYEDSIICLASGTRNHSVNTSYYYFKSDWINGNSAFEFQYFFVYVSFNVLAQKAEPEAKFGCYHFIRKYNTRNQKWRKGEPSQRRKEEPGKMVLYRAYHSCIWRSIAHSCFRVFREAYDELLNVRAMYPQEEGRRL